MCSGAAHSRLSRHDSCGASIPGHISKADETNYLEDLSGMSASLVVCIRIESRSISRLPWVNYLILDHLILKGEMSPGMLG
jgi:hypothetical protein